MQNQTVKGFKATELDMTCRDFQYEVGETFRHEGEVIPCKSGFHFCRDIKNVSRYYTSNCRIFEVEASCVIVEEEDKTVTDTLTIVKEIDYLEYIEHPYWWVRAVAAHRGVGLDKLVDDKDEDIRTIVAGNGYGLDKLVSDSSRMVRDAVARQGYGLDILVHDDYWGVRAEVARQGYGLSLLVNDPDWFVRREVAYQGYGLDKLVKDKDYRVRRTVARQGYGLDVLILDKVSEVSEIALYEAGQRARTSVE